MTLGEKIKELRKNKGLSQEDLANKLNVSRQAVSKYEKDINEPNIDTIKRISKYFNVDLEYLLNDDSSLNNKDESKNNISNNVNNKNIVLYYILLIISILIILLCFIWSLIDPRSNPYFGEGFYLWYIPFYSSDIELIIFQVLNILGIIGIIISIIIIVKKNKNK